MPVIIPLLLGYMIVFIFAVFRLETILDQVLYRWVDRKSRTMQFLLRFVPAAYAIFSGILIYAVPILTFGVFLNSVLFLCITASEILSAAISYAADKAYRQ